MLQIGGRRGKIGRREIINRCNDECNNFSSARACGERSSVGHHGDVREADLVLQRSGRGPILRDTAQAEARESGVRRDIGNHHHVLSRAESQPVHRVRTLRDSRERNWAWSPECPCDGHHWRNESVFPIPPCPGTPPIITPVYLRIFSFSHFIHWCAHARAFPSENCPRIFVRARRLSSHRREIRSGDNNEPARVSNHDRTKTLRLPRAISS